MGAAFQPRFRPTDNILIPAGKPLPPFKSDVFQGKCIQEGFILGVTIHFRGQLADVEKIKILGDELVQVAEKMDWAYNRMDEDWSKPNLPDLKSTCGSWDC